MSDRTNGNYAPAERTQWEHSTMSELFLSKIHNLNLSTMSESSNSINN